LTTFTVYLLYRLYERAVVPKPLADLTLGVAALPLVAYAAMALSDVLVGDPALRVITPFTMGLPVLVAGGRLLDLKRSAQPLGQEVRHVVHAGSVD
jgi:hypothetical protein